MGVPVFIGAFWMQCIEQAKPFSSMVTDISAYLDMQT